MQLESGDVIQNVIILLKTLLLKDSQNMIEILNLEKSNHEGLQNEERGLLFTIHTQFVLFNLNLSPENMVNFYDVRDIVLPYLKTLFASGTHVLEEAQKAVLSERESESPRNLRFFTEKLQDESALLKVLYLTFISMMSSPVSTIFEVLPALRKITKAGIELQKILDAEELNHWNFLVQLNSLSASLLSKVLSSLINGTTEVDLVSTV